MDLSEIFIGAFIAVLLDRLIPGDLMQLARSVGIGSQLEKCRNTLVQIQEVVTDAEQKQMTDRMVLSWLDSLRVLAYDTDNILDDLATEAMHRKLNEESEASTSKVRKLFTTFSPHTISYGRVIGTKLDEIAVRLNDLVAEKNKLGLNVNVETSIRGLETSLVDEPMVVGREGDKEALLKKLCADETGNQNVEIVAIVGMGGIGKTRLAQILFYDDKVKEHFELKAWVCVSDEFDIFKITKVIFQNVTGDHRDFEDLNLLQVALQDKLSKKKFLLVLDDVWNEKAENWECLQRPFQVGAPGSKIIVTTRSHEVVSTMGGVQPYLLNCLSDDESLSLFAQHALGERDFDKHPTLKSYGVGIVSKCKGLPLALRTLGRALRTTRKVEDWKGLLNSEIWKSEEDKRVKILPALRLSYHHLPPYLKKLFAYCSLFPKDYVFDKDELVLLWMGEGFLQELKLNGNMPLEDAGVKCFRELLSRSFFQHSPNDESRYMMHDLLNDLATSVAGALFFTLDEKMNAEERIEALEKLHHFSFLRQKFGVYRKFEAFCGAKRLRTFLPVSVNLQTWKNFYLSNKVLIDILPQLQFLRVLSLGGYFSITEVPDSICDLKHLRYLNFSYTRITHLPKRVCQLYNLQTLLLCGCEELTELPMSFANLINLRHLEISDTPKLKNIPFGIGGLTSLQTLSKVIVEGEDGFKITELKDLKALRGRLSIKGLHKVVSKIHAKEANLLQLKGLEHLELEWGRSFDDSRVEAMEYGVFEALRPYHKLRKLEIVCYGGNKYPNWIGDPSFDGLTELTLDGCRSTSLPSVGHLPSLRKLIVKGMVAVKTVGSEMLGTSNSSPVIAFPSLEVFELRNMQSWEKWLINAGVNDETVGVFPCLRELIIQDCPNLGEVSIQSLSSLRVLNIGGCSEVVLTSVVEVTSCVTELIIKDIVGLTQLGGGMIERLGALEVLKIVMCKEVRYLWGSLTEVCGVFVKLRKLKVDDCGELVCLGERKKEEGGHWREGNNLTSLRELEVSSCPKMERLFGKGIEEEQEESWSSSIFPHLEYLLIFWCSGMKSLFSTAGGGGRQQLPSTLKRLVIYNCENLLLEESVVGIGGGENHNGTLSSLSSLEYLEIDSWLNSELFLERGGREGRFIHLTELWIDDCEGIESFPKMTTTTMTTRGEGFLPKGLRSLEIWNCKNLKSFPDEELQSLTSLVDLTIYKCPSMDSAFPRGLWPPNLSCLRIGGLKKPISEWGPQNFPTSLVDLSLAEDESIAEVVGSSSFSTPTSTTTLHLPTSLSTLELSGFKNLELISKDLQHLTSLQTLEINHCPKLIVLPETLLPSLSCLKIWACPKIRDLPETLLPSLSRLQINRCPKLKERCIRRRKRDSYYPLISGIPCVEIDCKDLFQFS